MDGALVMVGFCPAGAGFLILFFSWDLQTTDLRMDLLRPTTPIRVRDDVRGSAGKLAASAFGSRVNDSQSARPITDPEG